MQHRILRPLLLLTALVMLLGAWTLSAAALEETAIGIGIVTTDNGLYVRNEPSTSGEIVAAAHGEDAVVVLAQVDDWYHVIYNLEEGYVHSDYIQFKERENVELGDGIITETKVNLRAGPGTDNGIVCAMVEDETAQIIGFNCGWFKVVFNGLTGYVRSDLMDLTEKPLTNSDGFGFSRVTTSDGAVQSNAVIAGDTGASYTAPAAPTAPTAPTVPAETSGNPTADSLVEYAKTLLGCPYVYGGTSTSGFDCSGFAQYVYKQYGYSLNRTANDQMKNGISVTVPELQPGDLVFFGYNGYSNHVGIYIGGNQFIHAANPSSGVVITGLYTDYYSSSYLGARRIIN